MRDLGYVEGENLIIEWRYADGRYERLPALAAELVQMKLEVIATHSTPAAQALQRATTDIPIVAVGVGDPVRSGLAASLARPGGNVTGASIIATDLAPKHIELLMAVVPKLSRIAFLMNSGTPLHPTILSGVQAAARQVGIEVMPVDARTPESIEGSFTSMVKKHVEAVIVAPDAMFVSKRRQIVELCTKNRFPSIFSYREDADAGGLMSYGHNQIDNYRRGAVYVDKILKGAKPADLPFEQPTRFELAINLKTARMLNLPIPKSILVRADRLIE